ncbi:SDR family NAD(P)-dependent oxidoreductase [Actinokineospora bangkokensis]|uniref:Dehydrogenase n=1 Tax=Actinokineospora bangkokensis TaxID=1193682 RepID=A0A1Q9LQ31_9PSEU|nr:SDR family NAD(P)-dependent oxidoreductase [Actinokineospora bangkokensis]OLR94129.1 hypothetical protein BJP25_09955 [Actinokineospora bangkokensis]
MTDPTGKVALVTGAAKGIGHEVARQLAALGHTVLLSARNREAGEAAAAAIEGDVRFLHLDVTDLGSVRAAGEHVAREHAGLDILVNNAGVTGIPRGSARELDDLDPAQVAEVTATNFTGVVAVTQAMLPSLRKAGGRVVNVTSSLATFERVAKGAPQRPDLLAYCASKAAMNMATVFYAAALAGSGVTVHAVSPGFVATDMNNFTGPKSVQEGAAVLVRHATAPAESLPDREFLTESGTIPW